MTDAKALIARISRHDSRLRELVGTWEPVVLPDDLTLRQIQLLFAIRASPGATGQVLAEALQVSTPTISGLVDRLVSKSLLVRGPHPGDRRRVVLTLSDGGRQALEDLEGIGHRHRDRVLSHLTTEELADFERILERLVEVAEQIGAEQAAAPGASPAEDPP